MDLENIIRELKILDPNIEYIALHGGCYHFHKFLKLMYPDAKPFMNTERNHVISLVNEEFYDITGKLPFNKSKANFHPMTETEKRVAEKWSFHK